MDDNQKHFVERFFLEAYHGYRLPQYVEHASRYFCVPCFIGHFELTEKQSKNIGNTAEWEVGEPVFCDVCKTCCVYTLSEEAIHTWLDDLWMERNNDDFSGLLDGEIVQLVLAGIDYEDDFAYSFGWKMVRALYLTE